MSTLMMVAMADSRNTGAMASWMTRVMSKTWESMSGGLLLELGLGEGVRERQQAHGDDADDDRGEVAADPRDVAEEEPRVEEQPHPRHAAGDVVERVFLGAHERHAGHERHVGADDGQEARDHHRLAAVALVEG